MRQLRWLFATGAGLFMLAVVAPAALADAQHGVGFTKGCTSPTSIGQPNLCSYTIRNTVDDAQDTLTFNGIDDVTHAAGGNVDSGNIFSSLAYTIGTFSPGFSTAPSCTGGVGNGSPGNPFRSAPGNLLTSCTLPFGSRL